MTYQLGPIDPDRRPELFADPRDGEPESRPRRLLATALALLVMGLFGGGLWFAYTQGARHPVGGAGGGNVPLIRADERPTKVRPERPGGMEIPDRDKLIYNPMRPVVEHLLPPPEKPMPRPVAPSSPAPRALQPSVADAAPASNTPVSPPAAPPAATHTQQAAAASPGGAPQAQPGPPKTAPATAGGTRLQLGSVRSEEAARQEWDRIKRRNTDLLGALSAQPIRADLGERGIIIES